MKRAVGFIPMLIYLGTGLGGITVIFAVSYLLNAPADFTLGLNVTDRNTEDFCTFSASITNRRSIPVVLNGVQFQWVDRAGRMQSCHSISAGWGYRVQPKTVVTTSCLIPSDAKKLRVRLCGSRSSVRKRVADLAERVLPPRFRGWIAYPGLYEQDVHSPFGWTANPLLAKGGHRIPASANQGSL